MSSKFSLFFHNARGIYMFFVLSVSFVFLGSFLIIQSLFNININEDKLNNNIYSKIHSRFNIHADFSSFIKERNNIINYLIQAGLAVFILNVSSLYILVI